MSVDSDLMTVWAKSRLDTKPFGLVHRVKVSETYDESGLHFPYFVTEGIIVYKQGIIHCLHAVDLVLLLQVLKEGESFSTSPAGDVHVDIGSKDLRTFQNLLFAQVRWRRGDGGDFGRSLDQGLLYAHHGRGDGFAEDECRSSGKLCGLYVMQTKLCHSVCVNSQMPSRFTCHCILQHIEGPGSLRDALQVHVSTPKQQNDWMVWYNISVSEARTVIQPTVLSGLKHRSMLRLHSMGEPILAGVVLSQALVSSASMHLFLGDHVVQREALGVSGYNEFLCCLIMNCWDESRDLRHGPPLMTQCK